MINPFPMTVYNGSRAEGEIEGHGRGDIRAWIGVGEDRVPIGTFPDRKSAMRAVSKAVKAAEAAR
jgi:hypothetical protein